MSVANIPAMAACVREKTGFRGHTAVILGSGLGDFAERLQAPVYVPYRDIPGYPEAAVTGHAGEFACGTISGHPVLAAKGRFHYYEGHPLHTITLPIRLLHRLGVRYLIITNAAGSLDPDLAPGTLMVLTGHFNCTFLSDPGLPRLVTGPPFYDPEILERIRTASRKARVPVAEGIYCWTLGPNYETPAEIVYFRNLGGHAVGMSTVPEILTAGELGLAVLGISCLTNYAAGITGQPLAHQEVMDTAAAVQEKFTRLLVELIRSLPPPKTPAGQE